MARDARRVLLIANPASQNGRGADAAAEAEVLLREALPGAQVEVRPTAGPRHGRELAAGAAGLDVVVALGGDGIIHEVVNGLMTLPADARPALGVIPVGSGNDYAATLSMERNVAQAVAQLVDARPTLVDVGCVNGVYFAETLSFGLDAAIALDTVERRKKSGRRGTILYMESGIDQLLHHLVPQTYKATLEGVPGVGSLDIEGESYIFAVQVGRTYGGHFDVCPKADPTDGLFDVCITRGRLNAAQALGVFMLARFGLHTRFRMFRFFKAASLTVDFEEAPAVQADGEKLEGARFEVRTVPAALDVLVGDVKA